MMNNEYPDAINGDIYLNPYFGDMWIVDNDCFVKINDGYRIELDDPAGFIKVGHVDGIETRTVIEAEPVVHCKDCKYLMFSDIYGECRRGYLNLVQPNDFCSRGEPKEEL